MEVVDGDGGCIDQRVIKKMSGCRFWLLFLWPAFRIMVGGVRDCVQKTKIEQTIK